MVRGAGIVASRFLQRMIDDHDQNGAQTRIVHLFRSYPDGPQGDKATFRRPARKGWSYQAFNYPKAAWGGQLRDRLQRLEGEERSRFIDVMGGTNTATRADWQEQLHRGAQQGFYRQLIGSVKTVTPAEGNAGIRTVIVDKEGNESFLDAGFIVDATGLEAGIEEHRVLRDLLQYGGASRNPKGRLDVDRDFTVRGTQSGTGRLYASGSITLAATTPASTRSSVCSTPRCGSPTHSPRTDSVGKSARCDPPASGGSGPATNRSERFGEPIGKRCTTTREAPPETQT